MAPFRKFDPKFFLNDIIIVFGKIWVLKTSFWYFFLTIDTLWCYRVNLNQFTVSKKSFCPLGGAFFLYKWQFLTRFWKYVKIWPQIWTTYIYCNSLKLYNKFFYNITSHHVKILWERPRGNRSRADFVSDTPKFVKLPIIRDWVALFSRIFTKAFRLIFCKLYCYFYWKRQHDQKNVTLTTWWRILGS